ncbi:hypothetical protein CAEBREN_18430 [Caenorhabditis brenneri]|uniref:Uncharacterized protein n=1 Tax=Caenorhabditis brenneri TaxID=135651 RepID=G0PDW1_CAEBE|nr:hypothetical protein CAEBREN_18430 [Caenorhabditis brenneri]
MWPGKVTSLFCSPSTTRYFFKCPLFLPPRLVLVVGFIPLHFIPHHVPLDPDEDGDQHHHDMGAEVDGSKDGFPRPVSPDAQGPARSPQVNMGEAGEDEEEVKEMEEQLLFHPAVLALDQNSPPAVQEQEV